MTKTLKILSLLALPLLSTSTLFAYEDKEEPSNQDFRSKILKKFDKDGDLQISKAEAPHRMKENFARHDLNADGYIAEAELDTLPKHKRKEHGERPPRQEKRD